MTNKLKIGLDYHGVITRRPEYFAAFAQAAVQQGCEIHIVTGGPQQVVAAALEQLHLPYTRIFAILDYYEAKGLVEHLPDGNFHIPNALWDSAKAEYCRRAAIDVHIDDSNHYIKWFTTPYCRYVHNADICYTADNIPVDFSQPPASALAQIMRIIS